MVIALAGKIHSGKGTISNCLIQSYGFKRIGFADAIKDIARDIGWDGVKDESGRKLLQNLGSALRHHLGPEVLTKVVLPQIIDGGNWVIDDMRTQYEANELRKNGAVLIKIERPNFERVGQVHQHITETDLDNYHFDHVLVNDSDVDNLKHKVDKLLRELEFSSGK